MPRMGVMVSLLRQRELAAEECVCEPKSALIEGEPAPEQPEKPLMAVDTKLVDLAAAGFTTLGDLASFALQMQGVQLEQLKREAKRRPASKKKASKAKRATRRR